MDDFNVTPIVVYVSLCIALGVPANALVCLVFSHTWKISKVTTTFIIFLSTAGGLACAVCLPMDLAHLLYTQALDRDHLLCRLETALEYALNSAIALILLAIAVDRYFKVLHPHRVFFTPRRARCFCLVSALLPVLGVVPIFQLYGSHSMPVEGSNSSVKACMVPDFFLSTPIPVIFYSIYVVVYGAIFLSMTVIYVRIGSKLRLIKKKHVQRTLSAAVRNLIAVKRIARRPGEEIPAELRLTKDKAEDATETPRDASLVSADQTTDLDETLSNEEMELVAANSILGVFVRPSAASFIQKIAGAEKGERAVKTGFKSRVIGDLRRMRTMVFRYSVQMNQQQQQQNMAPQQRQSQVGPDSSSKPIADSVVKREENDAHEQRSSALQEPPESGKLTTPASSSLISTSESKPSSMVSGEKAPCEVSGKVLDESVTPEERVAASGDQPAAITQTIQVDVQVRMPLRHTQPADTLPIEEDEAVPKLPDIHGVDFWDQASQADRGRLKTTPTEPPCVMDPNETKDVQPLSQCKTPTTPVKQQTTSEEQTTSSQQSAHRPLQRAASFALSTLRTTSFRLKKRILTLAQVPSRTTLLIFMASVVCYVSYLPYLAVVLTRSIYGPQLLQGLSRGEALAVSFFIRSTYISNVANPFIYGAMNVEYRAELKRIVHMALKRPATNVSSQRLSTSRQPSRRKRPPPGSRDLTVP